MESPALFLVRATEIDDPLGLRASGLALVPRKTGLLTRGVCESENPLDCMLLGRELIAGLPIVSTSTELCRDLWGLFAPTSMRRNEWTLGDRTLDLLETFLL